MKDFFISYNRHDKAWAEWLAWTLEETGYTVVIQAWDFRPGGNFVLDMQRAAAECKKTIAVLSEHYLKSEYAQSEWSAAFAVDPLSLQRRLIPMRVGVCKPEGVLKTIVYVDLVGVAEPALARQLVLDALKARAKPDQEPGFPGSLSASERTEPLPVAFPPTERAKVEAEPQSGRGRGTQRALPVLKPFQFDVITVNERGQEVSRKRKEARAFTENLGHGIGLELVSIPGGSFLMGAPAEEADDSETPQHIVTVKPFFIGKYLITQAQWLAVEALPPVNFGLNTDFYRFRGDKLPATEHIRWDGAVEFCDRLSLKTGRHYRLPSEAEWEYACRAGTTTPFHFGETLTSKLANYNGNYPYLGGPKGECREHITLVGTFPPNAFGLYDMHGNVMEWCADHRHKNYQGAPTDGSAWIEGGDPESRVVRGGGWGFNPWICRSASRSSFSIYDQKNFIGFRVVCAAP